MGKLTKFSSVECPLCRSNRWSIYRTTREGFYVLRCEKCGYEFTITPKLLSEDKRRAKRDLLVTTIILWILTPLAFLSIPLIGVSCALTASLSTYGYIIARKKVKG